VDRNLHLIFLNSECPVGRRHSCTNFISAQSAILARYTTVFTVIISDQCGVRIRFVLTKTDNRFSKAKLLCLQQWAFIPGVFGFDPPPTLTVRAIKSATEERRLHRNVPGEPGSHRLRRAVVYDAVLSNSRALWLPLISSQGPVVSASDRVQPVVPTGAVTRTDFRLMSTCWRLETESARTHNAAFWIGQWPTTYALDLQVSPTSAAANVGYSTHEHLPPENRHEICPRTLNSSPCRYLTNVVRYCSKSSRHRYRKMKMSYNNPNCNPN